MLQKLDMGKNQKQKFYHSGRCPNLIRLLTIKVLLNRGSSPIPPAVSAFLSSSIVPWHVFLILPISSALGNQTDAGS
jgi:hypothetical protein